MEYYSRFPALGYERPCYWHQPGDDPLISLTVGQLMDWAVDQYGDREALVCVFEDIRWTFRQVLEKADELAAGLLSLGVNPGDMIALWGYNSSYHYLATLAAARAGLKLAKLDPQYAAPELRHCMNKVEAKLLIAVETNSDQGYYQILRSLAPELDHCEPGGLCSEKLPQLSTLILTGNQPCPGAYLLADVLKLTTADNLRRIRELQHAIEPDDVAFIHYTSGTTGTPKAAAWTHHSSVIASKMLTKYINPDNKPIKSLCQMQCCHIGTSLGGVILGLHTGGTAVFAAPKFDPKSSIKVLQNERCEIIFGTPAMYVDLLTEIKESNTSFTHTTSAFIGGSTISEALGRQIMNVLPLDRLIPVYGMTEAVPLFGSCPGDTVEQAVFTVGKAIANAELKVVDKEGKMVPFGTPGELWVRGSSTMKCYWNDEETTRKTITNDKWLKTGDQIVLQSDGYGKIVGRLKDSIIRGSDNIYPREIEDFFLTHPDIVDVQAFGVPDARWTEEVCVYVRLREGSNVDEEQLRSFCKGKVSAYRIPRYIRFVEKFPQNLIGKIDKKKIREEFLQDKEYLENNATIMKRLYGASVK